MLFSARNQMLNVLASALALSFALGNLASLAHATPTAPVSSPLRHLAQELANAPSPLRADLAMIALEELAQAYHQEAQRARSDQARQPQDSGLRRWRMAVENLALELNQLAREITPYTPVQISVGADQSLALKIANRSVLLSNPRPREQVALEQRVLQRYCELNGCDPRIDAGYITTRPFATDAELSDQTTDSSLAGTTPQWRFNQHNGPICETEDGLEFQFRDLTGLSNKRLACKRIVSELRQLANALQNQPIDWSALSIRGASQSALQRVVINYNGDELTLPLPALAASPQLFDMVHPWLAAQLRGQRYHLVIINAEWLMEALLLSAY